MSLSATDQAADLHDELRANTAQQEELITLAGQIRAWQDSQSPRISNEEMVRRFPALGSTKTYRRVAEGDLTSLILSTWIPKFRGVWAQIEELTGDNGPEEIYQDLGPAFETARAAALLIPQRGNERLLLIEGPTGSGKTKSLRNIEAKYKGQCIFSEAKTSWANPNAMLSDLLVAYSVYTNPLEDPESKMPASYGLRLAALNAANKSRRRILLIDEGHHLTAEGLNIIKGMLNDSDMVIIIAAIDTIWRKLAAKSWSEAAQLVYNRLFERVRLVAPEPEDAEIFLSRRVPEFQQSTEWKRAIGHVCGKAKDYGHFAFLRRLAKRMNQTEEKSAASLRAEADHLETYLKSR